MSHIKEERKLSSVVFQFVVLTGHVYADIVELPKIKRADDVQYLEPQLINT